MKLYGGIDLHSTNSYVVLLNEKGKVVYDKRINNDKQLILRELEPYKKDIDSLTVESTYNWYWLVDTLQQEGYKVMLANPAAIQQYSGLKHSGDKTDATWLAEMLRIGVLPTGYIYPKEERGTRDLLRRRGKLVQHQTSYILSIQTIIERNTGARITSSNVKQLTVEELNNYIKDEDIILSLSSCISIMHSIHKQIEIIEKAVLKKIKLRPAYKRLLAIDGIGKILALTIMLETGDIKRFRQVGDYASYCRCVNSKRISNGKKKGENNRKNGNRYLSWAYIEAANFAIRHNKNIKKYSQRKMSKTNKIVAIKTVAHKLARACYYIIRDGDEFDELKLFN